MVLPRRPADERPDAEPASRRRGPIHAPTSRNDFEAIFHDTPDAIVLVDADGLIREANDEAEIMFGWSRDELVGESVELLIPQALRDDHRRHRSAYGQHPVARPMGVGMELQAIGRDGVAFPVEISLGPSLDPSGELLVVCVVRGITQSEVLRRVAAARVVTTESERKRIALEVHDDVKQSLTATQLQLEALIEVTDAMDRAPEMVAGIQDDLDRCHEALDRVIGDLMPVELEGHAVHFALSILCRRVEEDGFVVERDIQQVDDMLDDQGRLGVFRIVQEALNNAKQHSGAGRATVRYGLVDGRLLAEVCDHGAGFSPGALEPQQSFGLGGMRERSRILGARLTVASSPGEGACVRLEVPVGSAPPPEDDPA